MPKGSPPSSGFSRRTVLAGALALAACDRTAASAPAPAFVPPLKSAAPFPIGTCIQAAQLDQPDWVNLALTHCSQLTPEWEMKMEYIVQPDGTLLFDRPDRMAAFAKTNHLRLYGTTLVWYAQKKKISSRRPPTRRASARPTTTTSPRW